MFETAINPWHIAELDFPKGRPRTDELRFLLNYAVLAPSGHNTQPWLFKVGDDWIEIHADKSHALPVIDPGNRELIMSCGAALFNLRLALRHFGYQPQIELLPDAALPDLMARIRVGDKAAPAGQSHEKLLKSGCWCWKRKTTTIEEKPALRDSSECFQSSPYKLCGWFFPVLVIYTLPLARKISHAIALPITTPKPLPKP